jgi:hypothetical protein
MRAAMVVMALMACGSKTVPVPELDPADWQHVQELARPAGPNGPTVHLERAIDIATKRSWIMQIDDKPVEIATAKLPGFELVMVELRRWREQGGVILHPFTGMPDPGERVGSLTAPLLATADPEAVELVGLMGRRMLEQTDSLLNTAFAVSLYTTATRKQHAQIDHDLLNRGFVRGVAGEVVLLRRVREQPDTAPRDLRSIATFAAETDEVIQVSLEILREISACSTGAELIERLREREGSNENTQRFLGLVATLLENWRDAYR